MLKKQETPQYEQEIRRLRSEMKAERSKRMQQEIASPQKRTSPAYPSYVLAFLICVFAHNFLADIASHCA